MFERWLGPIGFIAEADGASCFKRCRAIKIAPYYDLGYQRAAGVFETILAINGVLFHPEDHIFSIMYSCEELKIPRRWRQEDIIEKISLVARHNKVCFPRGVLKIFISANTCDGRTVSNLNNSRMVVLEYGSEPYPPRMYEEGIILGFHDFKRPFPTAKGISGGYDQERVYNSEFYDLLFCHWDDQNGRREVTECSRSNFFYIRNGVVYLPSRDAVLDGVTRKIMVELMQSAGIQYDDTVHVSVNQLRVADAVGITSTTAGVVPVASIKGSTAKEPIQYDVKDSVLRTLITAFDACQKEYFASRTN